MFIMYDDKEALYRMRVDTNTISTNIFVVLTTQCTTTTTTLHSSSLLLMLIAVILSAHTLPYMCFTIKSINH